MRCLALAQACRDSDLDVALASAELPSALVGRWSEEGVLQHRIAETPGSLEDANCTARLSHETGARWVVVDGYQFSPKYLRRLKELGCAVLSIDDCGYAGPYCADVVLNQNAYADKSFYPESEASTRLLLGLRYLLLRREFRERAGHRERAAAPRAAKLLVTLGGSDPDNAARTVLESLRFLNDASLEVRFILGASNPHAGVFPGWPLPFHAPSKSSAMPHDFRIPWNGPISPSPLPERRRGSLHTWVSPFSLSPSLITSGSSAIAWPAMALR